MRDTRLSVVGDGLSKFFLFQVSLLSLSKMCFSVFLQSFFKFPFCLRTLRIFEEDGD